ncbi:peptidoglycan DD-metalloendopeptidase family protein [Patescibacteria group bacterium]|nr:peptidoglycan DD-metalloendopeptidase family protein [Patescibacteria group bacterium]
MKRHSLGILICLIVSTTAFNANAKPMIFLPFQFGSSWYVTQGQGGSFSHQGNQYYAFDFNKGSNVNSSSNPAYNQPLYSPVDGEIMELRDGIRDFQNNTSSNADNHWGWGNTLVIKDSGGTYHIRLCHFKYGSTSHLRVGDYVNRGDYIGRLGQTGFSTSPHLHIQVMTSVRGSSVNFRFVEGDFKYGDWGISRVSSRVSAFDDNGDVSLSDDFTYASIYGYGSWSLYSTSYQTYTGSNYRKHRVTSSTDASYFKWTFRVTTSGYYVIYAMIPEDSANEPSADYYFGTSKVKTVDQRYGEFSYITTKYMSAGSYYYVKVKGKTKYKYLVADSLIIRRM